MKILCGALCLPQIRSEHMKGADLRGAGTVGSGLPVGSVRSSGRFYTVTSACGCRRSSWHRLGARGADLDRRRGSVANPCCAGATPRARPSRWRPRFHNGAGDGASARIRSGSMSLSGSCPSLSCCPSAKAFAWPAPRCRVDRLWSFHGCDVGRVQFRKVPPAWPRHVDRGVPSGR